MLNPETPVTGMRGGHPGFPGKQGGINGADFRLISNAEHELFRLIDLVLFFTVDGDGVVRRGGTIEVPQPRIPRAPELSRIAEEFGSANPHDHAQLVVMGMASTAMHSIWNRAEHYLGIVVPANRNARPGKHGKPLSDSFLPRRTQPVPCRIRRIAPAAQVEKRISQCEVTGHP